MRRRSNSNRPVLFVGSGVATEELSDLMSEGEFKLCLVEYGVGGVSAYDLGGTDVVVIDEARVPKARRHQLLRSLRQQSWLPIAVIQDDGEAAGSWLERVIYLEQGADLVLKPPVGEETVARLDALWHRAYVYARPLVQVDCLSLGALKINAEEHAVVIGGERVHFTPLEYKLLLHLARRHEDPVEARELLEEVWGSYGETSKASLRILMGKVRKKLKYPGSPIIETIVGVGYKLTMNHRR